MNSYDREAIRAVRDAVEAARLKAAEALDASAVAAARLAELLGEDGPVSSTRDDDATAQAVADILGPPLKTAAARIEALLRDPETDDPDGAPSAR